MNTLTMIESNKICCVILTHQAPQSVARMCKYWEELFPFSSIVIAYGGSKDQYEHIDWPLKFYVDDPRLRVKDLQRECQSYAKVFEYACDYLKEVDFTHIYFTEYDLLPLRKTLFERLQCRMEETDADVLMMHLRRIDGTGSPHFLVHSLGSAFIQKLEDISVRSTKDIVLSAAAFGQYWKREVFEEVASIQDDTMCYCELWIPSIAHHIGYRVVGLVDQERYNLTSGEETKRVLHYLQSEAWTLHPTKQIWDCGNKFLNQLNAAIFDDSK